MLKDGYTDVPPGKIVAAVTHLEMLEQPVSRAQQSREDVVVRRVQKPEPGWYRDLYFRIGADWLWTSRLEMTSDKLCATIHDAQVEVFAWERAGVAIGLVELDFRVERACELAFFGVVAREIGQGLGRMAMNHAIAQAWSRPIDRFWVHTCTLDHPGALAFYMRSGFKPFRRQIEVIDDPRLTGTLPMTAAPNVPVIRPDR